MWASLLDNAVGRAANSGPVDGGKGGVRELEGYLPCELSSPPLDWSLHSRVRLTGSKRALVACVQQLNTRQRTEALQAFVASHLPAPPSPSPPASPSVLFASSLYYYRHPAASHSDRHPLTPHLLAAHSAVEPTAYDKRCLQLLAQRWSDWEQSLRSVYYQLRNGSIHHFYVLTQHATLLFLASPTAAASPASPAVVFSRSTASMRASLTTLGVRYNAPYAKSDKSSESDEVAAADGGVGGGRLPKGVRIVKEVSRREDDGLISSLLVVTGREDVHGVFDWLLNVDRRADDVPQLLCDRPFLHAVLDECEVERVDGGRMEDDTQQDASSNGGHERHMSVSVTGVLQPSTLLGMMRALRAAGDEDWSVRLWRADEAPSSVNINAVFTLQTMAQCHVHSPAAEHDECTPLCHDEIVHAALRTAGSVESPMVHTVRYANGVYHIKLQRAGVS